MNKFNLNTVLDFFIVHDYKSTKNDLFWEYLAKIFSPNKVFFHVHLRFTGKQGEGKATSLTPVYDLHPLQGRLNISWKLTAKRSPLHIHSSRNQTE